MFLSESYVMNEGSNLSADPMYGMELIQEAVDSYNELTMKMIKLEHTAIMNEDSELLNEGVKEFARKTADWLKMTAHKFVEYLERVRVQWTQLVAKISTKFLNQRVIEVLNRKLTTGKYSVKLPMQKWSFALSVVDSWTNAAELFATSIMGNIANYAAHQKGVQKDVKKVTKELFGKMHIYGVVMKFKELPENESEVALNRNLVNSALTFLKKRPIATKNIQIFKSGFTKICNAAMKEVSKGGTILRDAITMMQRLMNDLIISTNKCTTYAIRICNAVKLEDASEMDMDDAKEQARKEKGKYREYDSSNKYDAQAAQQAARNARSLIRNESVLDQF